MNETNNAPVNNLSDKEKLEKKIDGLKKERRNSGRSVLYGILVLIIGLGLCATNSSWSGIGLIIFLVSLLMILFGFINLIVTSSDLSHFELQQKKGLPYSERSGLERAGVGVGALILGIIAVLIIGYGACAFIMTAGNL